jgi:AAA family ATP:ADP antiporter
MITRGIEMLADIKSHELKPTVLSFLMIFTLMASYFVLRPVRDAMASDWSDSEVSMLWNLQFFISAAIVSLYGWMVSKIRFKSLVPAVYSIFAASFIAFYFVTPLFAEPTIIEKAFYVWVSAFSLFHLSVFWSLMTTTFSKEQGKRLFAIIAAGGSAGAIVGPAIPTIFAQHLGLDTLMLIAAAGLCLVVPLVLCLSRFQNDSLAQSKNDENCIGGKWWAGFGSLISNRYLLGIAAFILLYVFISSFVYFEQKNLLADYTRAERATILGGIDLVVNVLTFVMAFFITGRVVKKLGMPVALAILPVLLVFGLLALAIAPLIVVLMAIQVSRRAGNYAVTRPAREMLFTQVSQEERFKAKPVVDIVVYRGGDAVSGTLFALLTEGLGIGLIAVAIIGAGISAVWASVGIALGRHYEQSDSNNIIIKPSNEPLEIKTT